MGKRLKGGTSADAVLLMFIKLVTMALGLTVTRLLSQYFSYHDYGTYSQIILVVNTVTTITILGMVDGTNVTNANATRNSTIVMNSTIR